MSRLHHDPLVPAIQHNLNSLVLSQHSPHIHNRATQAVTQSWSSVPFPYFNIVSYAHVNGTTGLADILHPYITQQVTAVWFRLPPSGPEDLDDHLLAQGLTLMDVRPCMAAEINTAIAIDTDAEIVRVQDEAQCRDWVRGQALANGGFPPAVQNLYMDLTRATLDAAAQTRAFVAYRDGQAVACALLHLAGGVAGIWQVGTIPAARRQGYGTAITNTALLHAAQLGYNVSVLIATQMGIPVYRNMGFQEITQANVYLLTPA